MRLLRRVLWRLHCPWTALLTEEMMENRVETLGGSVDTETYKRKAYEGQNSYEYQYAAYEL
ncbi:MAG: hypothetical protein UHS51_06805 [Atopobiaceae bacterium]|nr:hypothetical protein [Atopobiaceae bacterium]